MGYYWDKMMSEVGPVALGMSLLALWALWVLSRRGGREELVDSSDGEALATRLQALRHAGRSQVKARLTSGGVALIEGPQLLDKSQDPPQRLEVDFATVFGEGLWLIRVLTFEGRAEGSISDERWLINPEEEGASSMEGDTEQAHASLVNPSPRDLGFIRVVKRLAQSKKLSDVSIRYALVYVDGQLKVRSDEHVKVMSLSQLNKVLKASARRSAASASPELDGARELWRYLKQRDLSAGRDGEEP